MSVPDHMQFDNICRTCLSEEQHMKSIFDTDCSLGETLQLFQMLIACTSVQVQEDDGLPAQICLSCIEKVARSFSFKKLCEESDSTLREVLKKAAIKDSEPLIGLKPSSDVALCAQETITDIDPNLLYIKMEFEEEETKIDQHLISDTEYTHHEEDKILENADNVTAETIKPNENSKSDAIETVDTARSALKIHANTHRALTFKCEKCHDICGTSGALTIHMKTMHGIAKSNVCRECGRGFNSSFNLTRHLRVHTGERMFACNLCDKRFKQESALSKHKRLHAHNNEVDHPPNQANTHRTLPLKCEECGELCGNSSVLSKHMKTVHSIVKPHVCGQCDRRFNNAFNLARHLRTHTDEKRFACKVCAMRFARPSALAKHEQVHADKKVLVCADCGRCFSVTHRSGFIAHQKMHLRDNTCVCDICGKKLSTKSNFHKHMKVHTGEKEHVCPQCGKAFSTAGYLKVHLRFHNGETRFMCEVCGKGCVTNSQLKQHMPVHTGEKPFKCNFCPAAFSHRQILKEHVRRHNGPMERTHICEYCQKGFHKASKLTLHLRTHTGEKPYACRICEKSFARRYALTVHLKTH